MQKIRTAVIGGDTRLACMVPCLAKEGCRVICYGTEPISEKSGISYCFAGSLKEALAEAEAVICGIPFAKGIEVYHGSVLPDMEIAGFCECLKEGQMLFGGVIPETVRRSCRKKQVRYYDFMEDEPLAIFNAVATAEGCVLTALKEQPTNLHRSRCLVLGYGKCGRVLADKLKGLSADVTICARKEGALALAEAAGMKKLPFGEMPEQIRAFEYIFNTVPSTVLTEKVLKKVRKDALIVDIASGKGGVDYAVAKRCGVRALLCPGLPGKYAPKASAEGMSDFVLRTLASGSKTFDPGIIE